MYEELVERLRELPHLLFVQLHGHEDVVYQAAGAIEDLISALTASNEVIAKSKPRWIPVTERLPEKRHSVLIFSAKGGAAEGEYDGDGWVQYRWSAVMGAGVVTHWMPLPEPPKGVLRDA